MEEMRQLIEKGRGMTPQSASPAAFNQGQDVELLRTLVADAERDLKQATLNHQALQAELKLVAADALDVRISSSVFSRTCSHLNISYIFKERS